MDQYKIDNFHREDSKKNFPFFHTLSGKCMVNIRANLCSRVGLPSEIDCLSLATELGKLATIIEGLSCHSDEFVLRELLRSNSIILREHVFINWYRYDKIDKMYSEDVCNHFYDIWYPGPDDIDLFDESFSWIISISHEGSLSLLRPSNGAGRVTSSTNFKKSS